MEYDEVVVCKVEVVLSYVDVLGFFKIVFDEVIEVIIWLKEVNFDFDGFKVWNVDIMWKFEEEKGIIVVVVEELE